MKTKYSVTEKNEIFAKAVADCEELAKEYIQEWKPINKSWEIIDGVAYVRVSDFKQVIKDKGSMLQQVNIAVQEANTRSHREGINFRIIRFEIEPGYSGTTSCPFTTNPGQQIPILTQPVMLLNQILI